MITLTSKQTQIRTILVSLLFGLVLALWPKAALSQTVLSQQQAGSVLAIEKLPICGAVRFPSLASRKLFPRVG